MLIHVMQSFPLFFKTHTGMFCPVLPSSRCEVCVCCVSLCFSVWNQNFFLTQLTQTCFVLCVDSLKKLSVSRALLWVFRDRELSPSCINRLVSRVVQIQSVCNYGTPFGCVIMFNRHLYIYIQIQTYTPLNVGVYTVVKHNSLSSCSQIVKPAS